MYIVSKFPLESVPYFLTSLSLAQILTRFLIAIILMSDIEPSSQSTALEAMRQTFATYATNADGMLLDDSTFLRYLRARQFDIEKSVSMLKATIEWRRIFGINGMTTSWKDKMKIENSTGKTYVRGYDRQGHALIYMRPRFENTGDYDGNLKHTVFNLEKATESMRLRCDTVEKVVLLIDYEGFSLWNAPPMKTSMDTLHILQNHYPERLFRAYFINPPWIFNAFWNAISPFVDPVTKDKIRMLSGKAAHLREELSKDIDLSVLESTLGGDDTRPFDSDRYLAAPFHYDFTTILNEETPRENT